MQLKMGFKKWHHFDILGGYISKMIINRKFALYSCTVCEFYNEKKAGKYLFILTHK